MLKPPPPGPMLQVDDLSSVRVYIPKDLRPLEARERAARAVAEVLRRFPDGVPTLDPEDDMQVRAPLAVLPLVATVLRLS